MRKLLSIITVGALAVFMAGSASAVVKDFEGTLWLDIGTLPSLVQTGVGVATVVPGGNGDHLTAIGLDGGITGSDAVAVTDPLVTAGGLISLRMYATLGGASGEPAVLSNISVGSSLSGTLTVMGHVALCMAANCAVPLNITFQETLNGEKIGVGIGGLLTLGGYVGVRVSVEQAPWTIHARTAWTYIDETTGQGAQATRTLMQTGFRHGPSSNTSTTALKSGVISFINPMVALTEGIAGNSQHMGLFSRLTIHFIPEPGMILLLGSGIAGLVILGRHRMRK
jgi:hypothetical protein